MLTSFTDLIKLLVQGTTHYITITFILSIAPLGAPLLNYYGRNNSFLNLAFNFLNIQQFYWLHCHQLLDNLIYHTRMKHFAIDYQFVCDLVANKYLQVSHVPSSYQLVDLLTKPLSRNIHQFLTSKISVVEPSSILLGSNGSIYWFVHIIPLCYV